MPDSHSHTEHWRTLHEFVYVNRPFRDVRRHVADHPQTVAARSATTRLAGLDLDRDIRMVTGDLQIGPHSARLPIHWEDPHHPALFPVLEATMEFAPVGGRRPGTRIGFFARYRPPLGRLGTAGDSLLGNRVVLETVVEFLGDLAVRLERALPLPAS